MTISTWQNVISTSPLRKHESRAPSGRLQSRHLLRGRSVGPVLAKLTESKRQAAVRVALVVRRARNEFWCEGHLGPWDGHCGYCILAGEGYVQSGDRRLCLACAEIEAKQVANAERAFARTLFESFREGLDEPPRELLERGDLCPATVSERGLNSEQS
jgi:hypothetical protein